MAFRQKLKELAQPSMICLHRLGLMCGAYVIDYHIHKNPVLLNEHLEDGNG